jgi:hypothetical protein
LTIIQHSRVGNVNDLHLYVTNSKIVFTKKHGKITRKEGKRGLRNGRRDRNGRKKVKRKTEKVSGTFTSQIEEALHIGDLAKVYLIVQC